MTAVSAPTRVKFRAVPAQGADLDLVVGTGATLWRGALVNYSTATGRVVAASAATARTYAGVAMETKTGNTGGTVRCRVRTAGQFLADAAAALTKAYLGSNVCISDSGQVTTASGAGTAAVQVRVGRFVEIQSGDAWVELNNISNDDV